MELYFGLSHKSIDILLSLGTPHAALSESVTNCCGATFILQVDLVDLRYFRK